MGTVALLQKLDRPIAILEVGTWLGSSLLTWDQSMTAFHSIGGKIRCIDPWKPYLISKDFITTLASSLPNTILVVDEAYIEFADCDSSVKLIEDHNNIVIFRTFSKGFGLAASVLTPIAIEVIGTSITKKKPVTKVMRDYFI